MPIIIAAVLRVLQMYCKWRLGERVKKVDISKTHGKLDLTDRRMGNWTLPTVSTASIRVCGLTRRRAVSLDASTPPPLLPYQ